MKVLPSWSDCHRKTTQTDPVKPCFDVREMAASSVELSFNAQLMKIMCDCLLIFQEPVDPRFVVHRLFDRFRGRLTIRFKQDIVINFDFGHAGVEPHGNDDTQIVRLLTRGYPLRERRRERHWRFQPEPCPSGCLCILYCRP